MGKQAKRSLFQTFVEPEELIKESNSNSNFKKCSWKIGSFESSSSIDEDTNSSNEFSLSSSLSSEDFMEDATSSSSSSSSSNGPLFQLSDLMDQLPIKRGLSKYYQGKSESFASLASVESLEDLVKRENPYKKKIKLRKSFNNNNGGLHDQRFNSPKATISKKNSYSSSLLMRNCSNNLMTNCFTPSITVHKDF